MKVLAIIAASLLAGGGLGGGGLSGFPAAPSVNGAAITPTSVTSPLGKFDVLDAGVLNVVGAFQANGAQLESSASGVFARNDFTVTSGNDATFSRHARVNGDFKMAGAVTDSSTAPTLTGFCTSPTITSSNNGTAMFQLDVGTSCSGISTGTINFPGAATGWECQCTNLTATATRNIDQNIGTQTTVVITNYSRTLGTAADWADGADVRCMCRGG